MQRFNFIQSKVEGKTILVAEDVASNYLFIDILLRSENYDVIHAMNGYEAVETVRRQDVDLVLMDLKMPVMDGLTAIEKIREFKPDLPIIVLTASILPSNRETAFHVGCNDYMTKPIDSKFLMETIAKYFDGIGVR
ncbi:MAG: response regulator [Alistipes sp.]|uniref:response regulator n=1 Tax=Alistipes sp. TaxID=1872444 RepID=UPI001DCF1415|nr:response regulator [Alistipes sp.]MBS5018588.1 response regulator [Alistipes sp.]